MDKDPGREPDEILGGTNTATGVKTNHRRIIICCDGTWNDRETRDPVTNVSRIISCLEPIDDRDKTRRYHQLPIYLDGIGTGTTWFGRRYAGATGAGENLLFVTVS
jgi:uncharacterized protein (DUF2235 family)